MMDIEDTSDIYILAYFDPKEKQSTDVHYRCQTGIGSFNWRMLFTYTTPNINTSLTINSYDADIFGSDDFICGTKLNLKTLLQVPKYLDTSIKFTRDYYNSLTAEEKKSFETKIEFESEKDDPEGTKFWIQCVKNSKEGGRIRCSLEILPEAKANLTKVGKGREEPNLDPYLPPPVGRFEFSLNPYKMINQLVGPKFRRKCYCYCLLALLIIYLAYALPTIIANLVF